MFRVHSVSQRPNLRHLGEPLGGAEPESLLEAVSFKKATEGMGRGRVANARLLFTARRYALRGLSHRNSVRLSVCLSVTLVDWCILALKYDIWWQQF